MAYTYLEFEKPISDLENKIESLRDSKDAKKSVHDEISSLSTKIETLTKEIYDGLSIWQKVQVARHPHRPHFSDYLINIFTDFDELHGDRLFGDDQAIIGGLARFKGQPVVIIGHEKGKSTEDKISRNFGMSQPEGYRKASRLMKLAEDFSLPIITFIDTPGAYPGIESEERGMSEAIAKNLSIMSSLRVPIIVIITGEGGSGGALAIGVGDHISMLQYSIYSVASPEACASIVWRDGTKAQEAAEAMKLDAKNLLDFGLVDTIIEEPLGGAHRDTMKASNLISQEIDRNLKLLNEIDLDDLIEKRYKKIMSYGSI
ncbi:MAG: acetyl-CoA carboxylase carboxyltransferase subunit alpha [Gammaproteobacteria bacterium]|nr:MAG: acetyl-CoA carboxylase carboxyltransferase subunit alpha [Gammaproteobacteria bacterium]|tara:strand:+ start:156 stop:1103 length:948 start_codon:yes stop_codon:yes gene_type:complete